MRPPRGGGGFRGGRGDRGGRGGGDRGGRGFRGGRGGGRGFGGGFRDEGPPEQVIGVFTFFFFHFAMPLSVFLGWLMRNFKAFLV